MSMGSQTRERGPWRAPTRVWSWAHGAGPAAVPCVYRVATADAGRVRGVRELCVIFAAFP